MTAVILAQKKGKGLLICNISCRQKNFNPYCPGGGIEKMSAVTLNKNKESQLHAELIDGKLGRFSGLSKTYQLAMYV